jgi:hypothetical protein
MSSVPLRRDFTLSVVDAECPLRAFWLKLRAEDCKPVTVPPGNYPLSAAERRELVYRPFQPIAYFGRKYAGGGCETYDRLSSGVVAQLRERDFFGVVSSRKPAMHHYEGE